MYSEGREGEGEGGQNSGGQITNITLFIYYGQERYETEGSTLGDVVTLPIWLLHTTQM